MKNVEKDMTAVIFKFFFCPVTELRPVLEELNVLHWLYIICVFIL